MALYDTCTDGLAMDTTPENERGIIQGVMVGARAAGILLMLVVGGWLVDRFGWPAVFFSVSAISVLPMLLLIFSGIRESDDLDSKREPFQWAAFRSFGSLPVVLLAVLGFVYTISLDGILTFLSGHLASGYSMSVGSVGLLLALSMVGRILGALSNSWITDKIGDKQSLLVAIGLATLACLGLGFEFGVIWIGVFSFLFGLAYGYYSAVYAAVAMKLSRPEIAASMFAIFMTFLNIGTVGGQAVGGMLTEGLGFGAMALILGVLNLVNVPIVFGLFRKRFGTELVQ
jgi:predicted MFS family arabinose efflux permease